MTSHKPLLLVVDDEPAILDVIRQFAVKAGFDVVTCSGGHEALESLRRQPADLAMVDIRMPDVNGLDVLKVVRETVPTCEVVLMTGFAAIDSAIEAIKLGARDYLTKPFNFGRLAELLAGVRQEAERRRSVMVIERSLAHQLEFCGMLGRSPLMQEIFSLIRRLAPHVRTALITGETGTGKELVARALHRTGPRRHRRFVTINCSAVVETLFESELFGHVRGAFTGATDHKQGLFEAADGGTFFLDEVAEMPVAVQAKLLRVLESGEVQRVGSLDTRRVDVSIIAATNRDLRSAVMAGRFRSDLFYRLNVVEVPLPPLRDRREDIPYLAAAFVRECSERLKKPLVGLSPAAERILLTAGWEGNVRELRNVIERACMLTETEIITERELAGSVPPADVAALLARGPGALLSAAGNGAALDAFRGSTQDSGGESLSTIEREHILRVLHQTGGNKKAAAKLLGLSRRALYRRLERHQLDAVIDRRRPLAGMES